jgi:peptide/nickel transport system substrate-binding protein
MAGGVTTAIGAAALLAGCGDDDDDTGKTATSAATTASGTSATAAGSGTAATSGTATAKVTGVAGAVRGGTFRTSSGDPFRGADPQINTLEPVMLGPRSYSWTHRYNVNENKVILDMATKLEQPDNMTTIISIRPDIKFHNTAPLNGRVATTDDLIYTYQRIPAMASRGSTISPNAYDWMDLKALQGSDKTTLTIKQTKPFADNISYMGQHFFAVVGKETVEANGGDLKAVMLDAGTGPYILDPKSDPNTKMTWNRNPDYFSHDHSDQFWFPQGGGYPDAYEQRILTDPSAVQAQLVSGDLDQLYYLVLNVDKVLAADFRSKGLQAEQVQANTNCQLTIALDRVPDTRVRQAFMKALDYDAIIKTVYLGDGELGAPIGSGFPDSVRLPRADLAKYLKYDAAGAKQLWSAAGAAAKSSYVLLSIPNQPFAVQMTNAIKESIEKTLPGVSIDIQGVDVPTWLARVNAPTKDWDFCVVYSESLVAVPDGNLLSLYSPRTDAASRSNFSTISTAPGVADLAKKGIDLATAQASETDPAKRTDKLHALQTFFLENAAPAIPLPVRKYDYLVANKRLKNIPTKVPQFFRSYLIDNWYLDPNKP